MKPILTTLAALSLAAPALAQTTREMAAHVHGVSKAEIAVEHGTVKIDLLSPGMDIVGFEHAADSAGDPHPAGAREHRETARRRRVPPD